MVNNLDFKELDFKEIVPRLGSQQKAFEELCCQLAMGEISSFSESFRLEGAGGDGGVEWFADFPDGSRTGLQAKFVFKINSLLSQAKKSLNTAKKIHPKLKKYIIAFPFDLTGPTNRRGKSGIEKFEDWREVQIDKAKKEGFDLEIVAWPASKLRSILLNIDGSGGISRFFFDKKILSDNWFEDHLEQTMAIAGPRYTPEINVETKISQWFDAFGKTQRWEEELGKIIQETEKTYKKQKGIAFSNNGFRTKTDEQGMELLEKTKLILGTKEKLINGEIDYYLKILEETKNIIPKIQLWEKKLAENLEKKYGLGVSNSPGFRQYMAEYEVSFPAATLDNVRELKEALEKFLDWLISPKGFLAFRKAFVLSGDWGVGKTHSVCDVAKKRWEEGILSCVFFGHQFSGEPDFWTRFSQSLGFEISVGKDLVLDSLNAAGQASGRKLMIFIDAINETNPRSYWEKKIGGIVQEIEKRPMLSVCFTCRTPFLELCLPQKHGIEILEHEGFKNVEHKACRAFFDHHGLQPPIAPILQPEFGNPLFLKILCETLKSRGQNKLPQGWFGISKIFEAFIQEKEKDFSRDKGTRPSSGIVLFSLKMIAKKMVKLRKTKISWSMANKTICAERPEAINFNIIDWLIEANLLIEDGPAKKSPIETEKMIRLAFERFGDFLFSKELLESLANEDLEEDKSKEQGFLSPFIEDEERIKENSGILSAISILISEKYHGKELIDFVFDDGKRDEILKIVLSSFPWRNPDSFSPNSKKIICEALKMPSLFYSTMEVLIAISWRPSPIDGDWIHNLLNSFQISKRDSFWCQYLHESYEKSGSVKKLIDAGFEISISLVENSFRELWGIMLIWFAGSADRRVKDWATRALIKILTYDPKIIENLYHRFIVVKDEEILERFLLACYGALIISKDRKVIKKIADKLQKQFSEDPNLFENALIRDYIRCILELANELINNKFKFDPKAITNPLDSNLSFDFVSNEKLDHWGSILRFKPVEFSSDFYKYTLNCLRPWTHVYPKEEMAKWIIQRVGQTFGYFDSECEKFDNFMLGKYGGGRAKPVWAERIGKKYKWIAMYQLASKLHDNVERKYESWDVKTPGSPPLILLEERKIDPTILLEKQKADFNFERISIDLDERRDYFDKDWVNEEKRTPSLKEILSNFEFEGNNLYPLYFHHFWAEGAQDEDFRSEFRNAWFFVFSYFVKNEDFENAFDWLQRKNFMGRWMPEGKNMSYGYVGEYPWATPFNIEEEDWREKDQMSNDLPIPLLPCSNVISIEWEYDCSLGRNKQIIVPCRLLFKKFSLWWNGKDSFSSLDGKEIFRAPITTFNDPSYLLMNGEELEAFLVKNDLGIIWTLLGEKQISGEVAGEINPIMSFSQACGMNGSRELKFENKNFFKNPSS